MKIIRNIPNILSFCRIPLAFAFIFAFFEGNRARALEILLISVLTDVADGWIARAFRLVSDIGKLLDPCADKFMQCTVLSCLCVEGILPVWLTVICIVKEVIMVCTSLALLERSREVVSSNFFGKTATVLFYCITAAMLVRPDYILDNGHIYLLMCIMLVASSVGAAIAYYAHYRWKLLSIMRADYGKECDPSNSNQTKSN